ERAIVAEICRQVDGLPLAIELAAARSRSLTLAEMLDRLEHRLSHLISDGREGPTRQLAMRDTIAWSYDLLDANEQMLFRRLAVFTGGFAAESVDALSRDLGIDVSGCIASLIDQSLVRRVSRPATPERLRLMETIREFASERLEASGELDNARRWHAGYFGAIAAKSEQQLVGGEQVAWLDLLEREHDNLRAALSWSIAADEVDSCLEIGGGIWRFWERRGHVSEGRRLLEQIVALADDREPSHTFASVLFGLGRMRYVQGDFVAARAAFERLVDVGQQLNSDSWLAGALTQRAHLATREGDYHEARRLSEDGLALRRRSGDQWGTAISLLVLGQNAHYLGEDARASQLTEECIAIFSQLGDRNGMSDGYTKLGEFALRRGKIARARGHIEEALAIQQELGNDIAVADSLALLGYVAIGQGNYSSARSLFTRSLTRLVDLDARWRIDPALEGLAEVAVLTGEPERAVRILAAAELMRGELGLLLNPDARGRHERILATARTTLGDVRFTAVWDAGRALSIDQVSAEALGVGQPRRSPV
ncbi:MAG: tetratricopeptide repeat protein, partial [Chloroflexota bacterium]|nr:tetratricopeptide repeat protein [Chloroflexota bacterium]